MNHWPSPERGAKLKGTSKGYPIWERRTSGIWRILIDTHAARSSGQLDQWAAAADLSAHFMPAEGRALYGEGRIDRDRARAGLCAQVESGAGREPERDASGARAGGYGASQVVGVNTSAARFRAHSAFNGV